MWRSSFSQVSKKGWVDLFDGKLLNGWTNPYDHGESRVVESEDGQVYRFRSIRIKKLNDS